MAEFNLKINDFLGKNIKADPLDLNTHEAQNIDGFEVNTKPGALVKRKGYTDQAGVSLPATYPAGWTIKNIFQFRVTKPSVEQIIVVHATVVVSGSDQDRIYVNKVYNPTTEAWVGTGWVHLTEMEEEVIATTTTGVGNLYATGLSSGTNDYYNGWYVYNWSRGFGSIVSDYVASSKQLILSTNIANQVSGDTFSVYRFPLIVNADGTFTADTGTSTTQVYDVDTPDTSFYELTQDFDDAYTGWTILNTTRSAPATISSHDSLYAGARQRIVHSTIASQTDGDSYRLYSTTRTLSVDDKIDFRQRPNVCIMSTGSTSRFPKQYPLWYGYIRDTYYFGQSGKSVTEGYYLEPAVLQAPHDSIFTVSMATGNLGFTDPVYIACAYMYDGYQVGQMTSVSRAFSQKVTSTDGLDSATVTLSIGYSAANNMKNSRVLNKRVTGVLIYASTDLDTTNKSATWHKIAHIPIREDYAIRSTSKSVASESSPRGRGNLGHSPRSSIDPGGRSNRVPHTVAEAAAGWTGTDPYTRTYTINLARWEAKSTFYTLDSGGMNGDMVNYSVADDTSKNSIAGNLFIDKASPSLIVGSPLKDDGTPSQDFFPLINVIDSGDYGINSIINLKIVNDYLYLFGDTKAVRMLVGFGFSPVFKVSDEYDYLGLSAKNGIIQHKNKIIGVFKSGVYVLDAQEKLISAPIEDVTTFPIGSTTISEAYVSIDYIRKEFLIAFPTNSKIYKYDLDRGQWMIHTIADAINSFAIGINNEIYCADLGNIYRLNNGTTDDGTAINPQWKSKIYSMGLDEAVLKEVVITYKSSTILQFDVYLNRGAVAGWLTPGDNSLALSTTPTTVKLLVPSTFRGKEFEFGISIPTASRAANTYAEVYSIEVKGIVEGRI